MASILSSKMEASSIENTLQNWIVLTKFFGILLILIYVLNPIITSKNYWKSSGYDDNNENDGENDPILLVVL